MDMLFWVLLVLIVYEACNDNDAGGGSGSQSTGGPEIAQLCSCSCSNNSRIATDLILYGEHNINHRYSSFMELIDNSVLLFGDDINPIQIPEGDHEFPFSFQLPDMFLPPSCRINAHCYVAYELQASIAKPWYMPDIRTEVTNLKVIPPLNLNDTPWARMPTMVTKRKSFGLLWWVNELFIVKATVDPSGFCVGNRIPVEIEIDNRSDRELSNVTVELVRVWTMTAWHCWGVWSSTWEESEVVSTVHRNERVPMASVTNWVARMFVPWDELPTLISICHKIIKMRYKLRITACVDSTLSSNLTLDIPVTIGNFPFDSRSQGRRE